MIVYGIQLGAMFLAAVIVMIVHELTRSLVYISLNAHQGGRRCV